MVPGSGLKGSRTFTADLAFANHPLFGTDPQPKHVRDLYIGDKDSGGIHINSGIPNHAFYVAAMTLGGHAWEKLVHVWYEALKGLPNVLLSQTQSQ